MNFSRTAADVQTHVLSSLSDSVVRLPSSEMPALLPGAGLSALAVAAAPRTPRRRPRAPVGSADRWERAPSGQVQGAASHSWCGHSVTVNRHRVPVHCGHAVHRAAVMTRRRDRAFLRAAQSRHRVGRRPPLARGAQIPPCEFAVVGDRCYTRPRQSRSRDLCVARSVGVSIDMGAMELRIWDYNLKII